MKKIVITQRLILNDTYYEQREALDVKWGKLFEMLGFLPVVLPYEYDFHIFFHEMRIDGILLTGGNDLSSLSLSKESKKRDAFEYKLIEYGIKNDIPIYGICRGMQVIAAYFGASFSKIDNQVNIRHGLEITENSKYHKQLIKIGKVNAFHNYAIDKLDDSFLVSATDEIGIIKAIEHKSHKIFAQMWHSEREQPFDKHEMELIRHFYDQ
jgi:putative glutamine amidotransferase